MLESFMFHHIGIAVKSIDDTAAIYVAGGYTCSEAIFDPIQNVNICWLTKEGMPTVELLAPQDEHSPVNRILEKNGVIPYHTCYIVDNVEDAVKELRKMKYVMVSKPEEAVAINNCRVCFLFNKNIGLIELVEAPANI
ncbi:VOC family protein [Bacteroides xylanisolvens]|uniref:VOC family protein n=1 Tax=Bacteroides xylanisolvens TaxID=371601 RepID=UPI001CDC9385|nr:VOC family protein [Bacteroides xylanisolvens]MCA4454495.1 VOC family protein [Bacteroides xylanisolvens]MCA4459206.1 VOC family protein [Bacteroides xylanisolvens]MCA4472800.1 VOC family protein [Bacteroides xylanisolvens]MCA4481949.1 VOC family protein [Bacteroides xylanisolvens]MCE9416072.1 VOC family protein [Bacteroides xylanisolvens]